MHIRKLQKDDVREKLCKVYDAWMSQCHFTQTIDNIKRTCYANAVSFEQARCMIDFAYDTLSEALWESGQKVLGTYIVQERHCQADDLADRLDAAQSNMEAIQMFKRSCRGTKQRMRPTDPEAKESDAALQEAFDMWSSTWEPEELKHAPTPAIRPSVDLQRHFDPELVRRIVSSYPNSRSMGKDGIHALLIKSLLSSTFAVHLLQLFDICSQCGVTPSAWNSALTVIIPKDNVDPIISKGRPITLTPILRRLFEKCLLETWQRERMAFSVFHCSQAGGRTGYCAPTNVLLADTLIKSGKGIVALLDITNGFDSVQHSDLLEALFSRNCPPHVLSLVASLFVCGCSTQLVVDGLLSDAIVFKRGILQGSPLSPFLFNCWIDDLAASLNLNASIPRALFYIDDVLLLSDSVVEMQFMLGKCGDWAQTRRIAFSTKKSVVLRPTSGELSLSLSGAALDAVDSAKYLGVPLTCKGANWPLLMDAQLNEANGLLRFFKMIGDAWPEWVRLELTRTFLLPKLDYCAALAYAAIEQNRARFKTQIANITKFDDQVFTFICKDAPASRRVVMRAMTLLPQTMTRQHNLRTRFLCLYKKLHIHHPLRRLQESRHCNNLLFRLANPDDQYKKWQLEMDKSSTNGSLAMALKTWLQKHFIEDLLKQSGVLHHYFLRSSPMPKADTALYHKNAEERSLLCRWRYGTLWVRRKCICGTTFNRGHVHNCFFQHLLVSGLVPEQLVAEWQMAEDSMRADSVQSGWCYKGHFTILDHLLNTQDSPTFLSIVRAIDDLFSGDTKEIEA